MTMLISFSGMMLLVSSVVLFIYALGKARPLFLLLCSGCALVLGLVSLHTAFSMQDASNYDTEIAVLESKPIVALSNNTQAEGSFLFVHGGSKESRVYDYMVKNSDGSLQLGTIKAEGVKIFQDSSPQDAKIMVKKCQYKKPDMEVWYGSCGSEFVEIHIPEGSVKEGFSVDVSN